MATGRPTDVIYRIVKHGTLKLEKKAGRTPFYNGVVKIDDMLIVVDGIESTLEFYNGHDGKLITSKKLVSIPTDVSLINDNEVAVCLDNGTVVILSLKSIDDVKIVKTLQTEFFYCRSLAKWSSDKLVVSGEKYNGMLCWGIVSITDGPLDSAHDICEGGWTRMAIKDDTVYISSWTSDSITKGVYAFDLLNTNKQKFLYQHQELKIPRSIMADRDYVYVCDRNSNKIHQLTDSGQLVTIHTVSSRLDKMFYDDQQGLLYTTSEYSNVITVYKMESVHQLGVPMEIMKMDDRSIQLFEEALKDGKETVHSIRIMVVGHMGVGKTTLVKRLLGDEVHIFNRLSTEGIDVYVNCCDVSLSTHEWTRRTKDSEQNYRLQRIAKVLNEQRSMAGKVSDELDLILVEENITESLKDSHPVVKEQNAEVLQLHSSEKNINQYLFSATNQQAEFNAHEQEEFTFHQQEFTYQLEEVAAHEQRKSDSHQQEKCTYHQQKKITSHQQECTSHLQEEFTSHQQEESTSHQQEECTSHQQECTSHPQEEFTSHQQEESSYHQQEESSSHQQRESTYHQQKDSTSHPQEVFSSLQQVESISYEQEEFTSHEQEEFTFHQQEEITSRQQEFTSRQQEEFTSRQQEEFTSHQQEEFPSHQQEGFTSHQQEESTSAVLQTKSAQAKANTKAMLQLLKENVNRIEDTSDNALLTIWDFAGQYAFYTTHQTFLTRRAIYLLVSDVSEQVTDLVTDDCYFDSKGMMKCQVHELVEVWLNSIHSCAKSPEADSPPVILVGTHVDKVSQNISPEKHKAPETQNATAVAVEFDLSSTSTPAAAKHSKKHKRLGWSSMRKKKKAKIIMMSDPSIEERDTGTDMGADADNSKTQEMCRKYFREIRSYLKDKPTRFHLVDEDFAIDNTVVDTKLDDLKRKIVEVASQQPYWGEQIPARWISLEQELMSRKAARKKVISREDVEKINKEGTVPIEKSEELDLFLRYLHETGTIIYFSIETLRENIVLDPTWLIDALKTLINARPNLPEGPAYNVVSQKWSDFKGKGILSSELIDAVWTKNKYPELHAHKDHLLLIMEQLNIIAKPRAFSEIGEKVEKYFLTPCMLRQESPREIISPELDPMLVSTPVLCCVFKGKFLPPPIFHRLIAACITRWPVAKKKDTSENLIFCGCCIFDLDLFHRLILHCKNHIVFARITRLVVDEVKTPDAMLCSRVRKFITVNLSKITSYLSQNLKYELCTWWSPSQVLSDDGSAVPFEMWFADEGHDFDGPISPEHMNHARLYVALVTVCTNALRDILLTHVPEPYTNIYKAIRAMKAGLTKKTQTRRGQWQNALLLPDQCQVVYPDPRGRYVAGVDQFDISLLYILIRNVSTVSASLMGWGMDPIEEPFRDKCLGASVERIRSYRNQIGHSMDGKMSQQDFDDYWNKLDSVLDDIEQELGRQGYYRAQLDKQKRQVISVYEAC
ncbi:hypothetical protein ACJMK2_000491 [Sinanodonta woodiana]|uniref:Uncharacterized protein n=1 Tax=Sinanodonta woodiana TaxID=1069815 RepID=A0ABD3XPK7_SINWO